METKVISQVEEYEILSYEKVYDLERAVNTYLKIGWDLYGYPFASCACFCQAIVKYKSSF